MIRIQKRSDRYHIDCLISGSRVRGALGTEHKAVASRLKSRLELAIAEGARSENWGDLRKSLPAETYQRIAKATGLKVEVIPTWGALESIFWTDCAQRVKLGKMAPNTQTRYRYAVDCFAGYLNQNHQGGETQLADITPFVIEEYKVERLEQILARPNSKDGNGLAVEVSVLHSVFEIGVQAHLIDKNPVRKGHTKAETEVNPFTGEELGALRGACLTPEERQVYTILRYTGLRISDVADLKWGDVQKTEIAKRTIKRGVVVHIPLAKPLADMLNEMDSADPTANVLQVKNNPISIAQVRAIVRLISERANVSDGHAHRFRHSLAVDLLLKGASVYEVAKILGDSVATVEKHYLKFIPEMRQKVRGLLDDTTRGLEAV